MTNADLEEMEKDLVALLAMPETPARRYPLMIFKAYLYYCAKELIALAKDGLKHRERLAELDTHDFKELTDEKDR